MTRPCLLTCLAFALAAASPALAQNRTHEVKQGETLNGIANRAGISAEDLAKANGLKAPYALRIGQTLKIPGKTSAKKDDVKTDKAKSATADKAKAASLEQQPFPAEATEFRLIHIANGRAMIEDDAGLWVVQQGSVLPDSSVVRSIEKRNGQWVLVTSTDRIIEVSK